MHIRSKRLSVGIFGGCCAVLLPCVALAQVFATSPAGTGYVSTQNPVSPNCVAPDVWTAFNGHYMCAPPQPGCQYGYSSNPYWNGGSWVYSCNAPPSPPPTPPTGGDPGGQGGGNSSNPAVTALAVCQNRAASVSITLSAMTRSNSRNNVGGPATQRYYDNSTGPRWDDGLGHTGNMWSVSCLTYDSTGQFTPANTNPFVYGPVYPQSDSGGG
jgi:hypothetical protein